MIIERNELGQMAPKMTAQDQRNAWMLYQAGFSTGWIAKRIYERCGYKNWKSCQAALFRAFRGRPVRTKKEAAMARFADGHCAGCGCMYDERTIGCQSCMRRFSNLNRRGTVPAPTWVSCNGCGCPMDERTYGCRVCTSRHNMRARNRRAAEASLADGRAAQPSKEAV